jgi:type II secretory pathway pseudopilin PulG
MKRSICVTSAFSLVEVTLALGIAAFCLIAVLGLMPVAVQTNRNATSQAAATNIMAAVIADLRATPKPPGGTKSVQYRIVFGTATLKRLFFDGSGECSQDLLGSTKIDGSSWVPPLQTRYRLTIAWNPSPPSGLQYADLKVTWPAAVDPTTTTPSGGTEMFAAFDRN